MLTKFSKNFKREKSQHLKENIVETEEKKMTDPAAQLKMETAYDLRVIEKDYLQGQAPVKSSTPPPFFNQSQMFPPGHGNPYNIPYGFPPHTGFYNPPPQLNPAPPVVENPNVIELPKGDLKFIEIPEELKKQFHNRFKESLQKDVEMGEFQTPVRKDQITEPKEPSSIIDVLNLMLREIVSLKQENKELKTICNRIDKRLAQKYPIERKKKDEQ